MSETQAREDLPGTGRNAPSEHTGRTDRAKRLKSMSPAERKAHRKSWRAAQKKAAK